MVELPKGTNGGDGKDFSMEKRLLLAFILMGAVLFLTPYFYKPTPPAEQPQPVVTEQVEAEDQAPTETTQPEQAASTPEPTKIVAVPSQPVEKIGAEAEKEYTIETEQYKVVFSNRGAVVKNWVLKGYLDSTGEPLELVNAEAASKVGYPFSIEFPQSPPTLDPNAGLFAAKQIDDGLGIEFELSDGQTYVRKSFRFRQSEFLSDFSSEVSSGGVPVPHLLVWRGGFGDMSVMSAATKQHSVFYDLNEGKLVENASDEAKEGPVDHTGSFSFAGLEDVFFAAVALPRSGAAFEMRTFSDPILSSREEKELPHVGAAIGGQGKNAFPLYVGPKDLDLLKEVDPKLQQLVDFGWFSILAKPLFLAMKWVHDNWVQNYGWAIVLLTIAINILLFPLKLTSLKSMKKMQMIQPQVQALNEKYKGLSMRDPRKQKQNEEMMELYQKHGVNPLGGCMPMVLQIPFFFAFYKVLSVAIELRGADWLWVDDLSRPETLAIRVLPVTMVVSQFAMQKLTPATSPNPSQQRIMYMMPLMMGFFFYGVSSGLVLYWLTSNLVGAGQQLLINKIGEKVEVPTEPATDAKSKKKGRKR